MTSDGQPFAVAKYKSIVEEQVLLSYLTKGGVSYGDSDNMTPYERGLALKVMQEFLDKSKAVKQQTSQPYSKDPKARLNA